ncbi:MAG: hypothetical protein JO055_01920 [Alphaproteobacteria bacterium]|nr:hypothetical protein [Alphaproteobacteria bacterium]
MAVLGAAGPVLAQSNCLPRAVLQSPARVYGSTLELGVVDGSLTLCAYKKPCWTVNPTNGALTASAATVLPGRSQDASPDAAGCVAGYCPTTKPDADIPLLWATSTNGARTAVISQGVLSIFDASSKTLLRTIPLGGGDGVPPNTAVTNAPIRLLYIDDTIHVVGMDAGPFAALWSFKDSGARLGRLTIDGRPDGESISVYRGGTSILDGGRLAVADPALGRLVILDASGKRTEMVRKVSRAPCSQQDLTDAFLSDDTQHTTAACRRTIETRFAPYYDVELARLPSGEFLAALSGKQAGEIAILDSTTLSEVKRLKLAGCAR